MCGIFGYVAAPGKRVDLARLRKIATATSTRGPHAFGFAWVDADGKLRSYKRQGRIVENLVTLDQLEDAVLIIGHTRWATQGRPDDNANNHPHACDGGWLVHNGMLPDWKAILSDHALHASTDCDSEVIALLIEHYNGKLINRVADAFTDFPHDAAVLTIWRDRVIVAKRGNPVCVGRCVSGAYFGSYVEGLPADGRAMRDGWVIEYRRQKNGEIKINCLEMMPPNYPAITTAEQQDADAVAYWESLQREAADDDDKGKEYANRRNAAKGILIEQAGGAANTWDSIKGNWQRERNHTRLRPIAPPSPASTAFLGGNLVGNTRPRWAQWRSAKDGGK